MTPAEHAHIAAVRQYFEGCSSGERTTLMAVLTPDVVHYFLPDAFPPVRGADALADYWCAYRDKLHPVWAIDHLIARDEEVVSEWSCVWVPPGGGTRIMTRGTEWYTMRHGLIAEIRAYFISDRGADAELTGFPYGDRGYLTRA